VEKLVNRCDDFEKRLESKSSVEAVSMLDDRIKGLEDRLTQFSKSTEEKFVELEKELQHNNEEGDKQNEISDKDLIKHVVQEEVNRKTAEERNMENRKRNIIVYGVPEKKTDNVSDRKTSDGEFVRIQFSTLSLMIGILIRCIDWGSGQRIKPVHYWWLLEMVR